MTDVVWIDKQHVPREIIIKIHGWCNLACSYCYMYEAPDQSWRTKPKTMSRETIDMTARRVAAYMREHELPSLSVILHGGEPFLAGIENIRYLVERFRSEVPPDRHLRFNIQTNGILLDEKVLDELLAIGNINVGVSLDGDASGNHRRLFANGRSSYEGVARALRLFKNESYRPLLRGILSVIDLQNDPVATYEHLLQFGAPTIDFLRPLGNWDSPPPGSYPLTQETRYADWLIAIFDRWFNNHDGVTIRLFEQILRLVAACAEGAEVPWYDRIELIGPWVAGAIVIEVDGSYELLDGYKTIKEAEGATGLNVYSHHLTQALVAVLEITQSRGIPEASQTCQECLFFKICGGDFYLNRYSSANGYHNPSVYCEDLQKLIDHIAARLAAAVKGGSQS